MMLGRKGLTSGVIKGLTVCCVCLQWGCVCALHCKHTALYGSALKSHTKQCAGADRGENYCLHTWRAPPTRKCKI
ncbi:unnamed protein product, partial [Staurois parvus]